MPVCLPPPLQRPPNHVWIPGVGSAADEGEVLRCCKEGDIPLPEHLLKVGLYLLSSYELSTCQIANV